MIGFVLHPDALTDLNEIWEFLAADSPGAADRVLEEIHVAIRALVSFVSAT
jgi:plasmid stabilization system protein ParE